MKPSVAAHATASFLPVFHVLLPASFCTFLRSNLTFLSFILIYIFLIRCSCLVNNTCRISSGIRCLNCIGSDRNAQIFLIDLPLNDIEEFYRIKQSVCCLLRLQHFIICIDIDLIISCFFGANFVQFVGIWKKTVPVLFCLIVFHLLMQPLLLPSEWILPDRRMHHLLLYF